MKEKVVVLFGGKSVEHDISIITAIQASKFLPKEFDYIFVYIDKIGKWWRADNLDDVKIYKNFKKYAKNRKNVTILLGENTLLTKKGRKFIESEKIFSVLNCCHGRIGEDGSVAGIFKASSTAQTSCGVVSASLCMDKAFMKDILKANNVNSPIYYYFHKSTYQNVKTCAYIKKKIGFPVIVKPANLGSSIGISVCKDENELSDAIEFAFSFDEKILVEKFIQNLSEFNCACVRVGSEIHLSSVSKVSLRKDIFTFEEKYLNKTQKIESGCGNLTKKIKNLTKQIYQLFDCDGVVRVDFLYDEKEKKLLVNEINTVPGSLAFYLFKDVPFQELIRGLISDSRRVLENERKFITTYDSDAIDVFEKVKFSCKK